MTGFTAQQSRRLVELRVDASEDVPPKEGESDNARFQRLERRGIASNREALRTLVEQTHEPALCRLGRELGVHLLDRGFTQVVTPTIIPASQLRKMTIDERDPLYNQVFWLDKKTCLRPMLAPGLYTVSRKLLNSAPLPLRVFEIGSCFRKESEGRRHLEEFTMLNVVEWGTPLEERSDRLREIISSVLDVAGVEEYALEAEESTVYGAGVDAVDPHGLELASSSMGPHSLDPAWRIDCSWVGVGFGLERLLQSREGRENIHPHSRSITYLDGATLNIK